MAVIALRSRLAVVTPAVVSSVLDTQPRTPPVSTNWGVIGRGARHAFTSPTRRASPRSIRFLLGPRLCVVGRAVGQVGDQLGPARRRRGIALCRDHLGLADQILRGARE